MSRKLTHLSMIFESHMIAAGANANTNEAKIRNGAKSSVWLFAELNEAINSITNYKSTM